MKLSAELVESAIQSAPSTIQMYDRRGNPVFNLGDDRLRFGVGVTALYYQEPVNDNLELFTRQHMRDLTRLGSALPLYDVISTPGIVRDVPEHLGDLYGSLEHFANTTKPLVLLVSDENNFAPVLDMFEHLHGGLGEQPFVLPYFNPVSPLVIDSGTLLKMEHCHRARIAVHLLELQHGRRIYAVDASRDIVSAAGRIAGRVGYQSSDETGRAYRAGNAAGLL